MSPRARLPYPRRALVLSSSPIRHGFPVSFRITQKDQSDRSTVLLSDVLFGQDSYAESLWSIPRLQVGPWVAETKHDRRRVIAIIEYTIFQHKYTI